MPAPSFDLPSKSQINKCGDLAVEVMYGGRLAVEHAEWSRAITVISDFRAAHSYPLGKVTMGLRSMVRSEGLPVEVTQRLKRLPRIIRKLHRMEHTSLARLQDIGGCRAVVPSLRDVAVLHKRLRHRWGAEIVGGKDYIEAPKVTGYRALHLVTKRDDRLIEVQIRTQGQQYWADQVEVADARLKLSLKDGDGPPEMIEFFAVAGEMQHILDSGGVPTDELLIRLTTAREAVVAAGYYDR